MLALKGFRAQIGVFIGVVESPLMGLANRCLQPLSHLSAFQPIKLLSTKKSGLRVRINGREVLFFMLQVLTSSLARMFELISANAEITTSPQNFVEILRSNGSFEHLTIKFHCGLLLYCSNALQICAAILSLYSQKYKNKHQI